MAALPARSGRPSSAGDGLPRETRQRRIARICPGPHGRRRAGAVGRPSGEGECGPPRGRGGGMHRVRGASGDVRARGPGFPPHLSPRAPPSPPVFHPPETPVRWTSPWGGKGKDGGMRTMMWGGRAVREARGRGSHTRPSRRTTPPQWAPTHSSRATLQRDQTHRRAIMPPPVQLQLPAGWAAYQDDAGRTYYHSARLGVTQWEPPKATQPSPPRPLGQGSGLGRAVRATSSPTSPRPSPSPPGGGGPRGGHLATIQPFHLLPPPPPPPTYLLPPPPPPPARGGRRGAVPAPPPPCACGPGG